MAHERSKALKALSEQVTNEDDPEKLRKLVIEIDGLLNVIEEQMARLEADRPVRSESQRRPYLLR